MSYFHCGNGYPDRCNGYRGPLDTYVCLNPRHTGPDVCTCGHELHHHDLDDGCGACALAMRPFRHDYQSQES